MKIAHSSRRTAGRPRKEPSAKKQGTSVTLTGATVKKMEAVRRVHSDNMYAPPSDSWMVEQGLERYFRFELTRYPQLQAIFADIERPLTVVGSIQQDLPTSGGETEARSPRGKDKGA